MSAVHPTVVTGYYVINSKYNHKKSYLPWIRNFMSMNMQLVIYGNKLSIAMLKAKWPQSSRRIYVNRELDSFVTSKYNWSYDLTIDKEAPALHSIPLYKIWNEKIFMVRDTIEKNPYNSQAFVWVDIGSFRNSSKVKDFKGFPDSSKFNLSKVSFLQIIPFLESERVNVETIDSRFQFVDRIGGTIFAGGSTALRQFANLHEDIIQEAHSHKVLAGKDQSLFAFEILRHPELFDVITAPLTDYDKWFALHELWADPNSTEAEAPVYPVELSLYYYHLVTLFVVLLVVFFYCKKRLRV